LKDKKAKETFLSNREAAWVLGITEPGLSYKRKNNQGPEVHEENGQTMYTENAVLTYLKGQIIQAQTAYENGNDRLQQIVSQRPNG